MTDEQANQSSFTELDEKLYELQALFDLSKALNSSLNLKNILDTILLTPMGKMLISKGIVLLCRDDKAFVVETLKGLSKSLVGNRIQIDALPSGPEFVDRLSPSPWQALFEKNEVELVIPILYDNKNLGVIGFGKKILGKPYSDAELEYLKSLSNIAATAVQNGLIFEELNGVNRQLDKRVQELNTLFEIGKELNSTLESNTVVNLLAYSIMGELMVNRCLVFLRENGEMELRLNKGFQQNAELEKTANSDFQKRLSTLSESIIVEDKDDAFFGDLNTLGIRALIPLRIQNETKGVVALGDKITKLDFYPEELDFLTTLGNLSMISIENARLFEETLEKQRLEEELQIASEIQKQLLPKACPEIKKYKIAALNISSRQVGGDYYDCFQIDEDKYAVCIADVSGKGAPAALIMSNLQASLHSLVSLGIDIGDMTSRINNLIYRNTAMDKFITYFFALLDTKANTLTSCNAGHNPPYLFHSDGTFQTFDHGGIILGMMPNMPYETETVHLKPGDCVVMFTDGVSEAMNAEEDEFEEKRIEACILENYELSADQILEKLIDAVKDFSAGQPQADDITSLIIKVS
ncbi:SpoIIE family protein phosphatase [bacterium]|nr:SpoIIE family protein phosphatase [bacterium]